LLAFAWTELPSFTNADASQERDGFIREMKSPSSQARCALGSEASSSSQDIGIGFLDELSPDRQANRTCNNQ
jgi:hypothetical protein